MTGSGLVREIASRHSMPRRAAREVVDGMLEAIQAALCRGERVELRGFGAFRVRRYEGYTGIDPRNGSPVQVPAKCLPMFRPGQDLVRRVEPAGAVEPRERE